tara:strand:- start:197 stop:478 length:282 start_codon:yes stop_codon:yes gene_type:complete
MFIEIIIIIFFILCFVGGAFSINEMEIRNNNIFGIEIPISPIKMRIVYMIILFIILSLLCWLLLRHGRVYSDKEEFEEELEEELEEENIPIVD